jgi:UDP-N-acetylglucosamine acyltransferase
MIHPSAVISPRAIVPSDVEIGPFCTIGDGVELGAGCVLMSHVSLQGPSRIGPGNIFHPFTSIGGRTQDLKYTAEPTFLEIGEGNNFREFVTVNRGTAPGEKTVIGSHNHFLAYCHIAHNCIVGNHCVFSNNGTLAGHVIVEDHVVIGGLSAVHQFCRLGRHCMIGGCTKIVQDVPPYFIADGNPAEVRAVNFVGLQRRGFSDAQIKALRTALRIVYDKTLNTTQALAELEKTLPDNAEARILADFIRTSQRGIIR